MTLKDIQIEMGYSTFTGLHTSNFSNGKIRLTTFMADGKYHGEYKKYNENGDIICRCLYINGKEYDTLFEDISSEEKLALTIKHNLQWLS